MKNKLKRLRRKIDKVDTRLVSLLEKRFKIINGLKKYKLKYKISFEDKNREKEIVDSKLKDSTLPKNFIKDFFNLVFSESKRIQKAR